MKLSRLHDHPSISPTASYSCKNSSIRLVPSQYRKRAQTSMSAE